MLQKSCLSIKYFPFLKITLSHGGSTLSYFFINRTNLIMILLLSLFQNYVRVTKRLWKGHPSIEANAFSQSYLNKNR